MTRKRLEEILERYGARLARRYRQVMQRARDQRSVSELEIALSEGRISEVLDEATEAARAVAAEVVVIDAAIGAEAAAYISERVAKLVSYDGTNPRAVARLQANGGRLVTSITEGQRLAIGEILQDGQARGLNPREVAREIRSVIGLTPERARYVANYRRALEGLDRHALTYQLRDKRADATIKAAIKAGKPLDGKRIDALVDRYAARQLAQRAEVIARTEMLRAAHEATDEAYEQAEQAGQLDRDRAQEEWHSGKDGRTRHSHRSMGGQLRRRGVPFRSGNGNELRYPGDPQAPASDVIQCRCRRAIRILPPGKSAVNKGGGYE